MNYLGEICSKVNIDQIFMYDTGNKLEWGTFRAHQLLKDNKDYKLAQHGLGDIMLRPVDCTGGYFQRHIYRCL